MAERKPISKRLRFEIFKRDDFTCQYCGSQPPAVVLELDHIHPVAAGGDSDPENLITACGDCNRGKGAKPLGEKIVRPDADLMYLQTQQEIAELRRYQEARRIRDEAILGTVRLLQDIWLECATLDWYPDDNLCRRLLNNFTPEQIKETFMIVAPGIAEGRVKDHKWQAYLWTVLRNNYPGGDDGE